MPASNWPTANASWPSATSWPASANWPSGYTLLSDPTILAMYEANNGLGQMATFGVDGDLASVGSAVPIAGSFDGKPAYQCRGKSGTTGYLKSANTTRFYQPVHVFVVGRFLAATTINCAMVASPTNGVANLVYWAANRVALTGGAYEIFTDPLAFHLFEIYYHSGYSFVSVDGGAFVKMNTTTGSDWGGINIGASVGGVNMADCDVLAVLKVEGQASESLRAAYFARMKAMFPTTLTLPASPAAAFSLATTAPAVFDYTQPWDAVICMGQSNMKGFTTTNTSAAWNAGTYVLGEDYLWKAGGDPAVAFQWNDYNNQTDTVALDSGPGGRSSLAGTLANGLHTAWTRPTVLVHCSKSASYVVPGTVVGSPNLSWEKSVPRGNNLRNSQYWSAVARAKEVIRWGGTIRAVVWYQGETEAQNASSAIRAAWPAATQALLDSFWSDIGLPNPRTESGRSTRTNVIVRIAGNAAPNWTDFRTNVIPTITQNQNQILVDAPVAGPFEADLIHLQAAPLDTLGTLIAAAILS